MGPLVSKYPTVGAIVTSLDERVANIGPLHIYFFGLSTHCGQIKMHLLEWELFYFDSNFTEICQSNNNDVALVLIMICRLFGNKSLS